MNEIDLERIANRLGERAAAELDVERTAAAVVSRLRSRPAVAWWRSSTLLRLAAALALTVGAGLFAYRTTSGPSTPSAAAANTPALLQGLSSDELEEVLDSLSLEAPAHERVALGLHDLNDEQLKELLQKMEG
ncbi:MAG: hypothetical protein HY700_00795 [Gemmatimonadetes bacterium]|nr:hypothetical protein [Gemmatimonadota bacterium]